MTENKHGGSRKGAGRKAQGKVYLQIYTNEKQLKKLREWYGKTAVNTKVNQFLKSLHAKGAPEKIQYNEQFLKDTE